MNTISDNTIKQQVAEAMQSHEPLNKYNIEIDVEQGNVLLNGNVETTEEISLAEEVARVVAGVESVTTNLGLVSQESALVEPIPDTSYHQETPGSIGAFPVGAFDTSKD